MYRLIMFALSLCLFISLSATLLAQETQLQLISCKGSPQIKYCLGDTMERLFQKTIAESGCSAKLKKSTDIELTLTLSPEGVMKYGGFGSSASNSCRQPLKRAYKNFLQSHKLRDEIALN